ncbi:hypothetical protein ACFRIB_11840 [Streptomyces mirabilis]|uniref:hypothetical protein n=1 Tax=Streptomyces mirabilis TaxID=68239 RepID=UPI0036BF567D
MVRMPCPRRVRDDLSSAENLEIYVTALLSLPLAALGALDVAGGKVLAAATLSTLAPAVAGGDAVFTLRLDRDGHWYRHLQAEFDRVREYGRPVGTSDGFRE